MIDRMCCFVIVSTTMSKTSEKKEDSFIKIGEAAEMLGVAIVTLRKWHETGELVPAYVSVGGRRFYSRKQIQEFLKGKDE